MTGRFHIGFVLTGGVLAQLGLRARDIIVTVNARKSDASTSFPEAVAKALEENEEVLRLELERDDNMESVYLEIDDSSGE